MSHPFDAVLHWQDGGLGSAGATAKMDLRTAFVVRPGLRTELHSLVETKWRSDR